MNQAEVRAANLKKSKERLMANYLLFPKIIREINALKHKRDGIIQEIRSDKFCIKLEEKMNHEKMPKV